MGPRPSAATAAGVVLLAVLVAGAGLLLDAAPAGAHASVETSDPADGEVLEQAPEQVSFTFDEGVRVSLGGLRVVDQDGERVDTGEVAADGQTATVGLEPDLPDGVYTAAFRIISADGHPVRGGIVFQVGDDVDRDAVSLDEVLGDGDQGWEVVAAVLRALAYLGALLAAGGGAFLVLVHDGGPGRERLVRWVQVGALVGTVALLLGLPVQAALATGLGPDALFEGGVLGDVLADGVGLALVVTVLGLVDVVVALRWLVGDARRAVVLVGATAAAAGFALSGHARTTDPTWLVTLVDAAHAVAVAAWFGGLVLLVATLRRRRADGEPVAAAGMLDRFSRLATVAVLVAGVAGLGLSWAEVRSLDALDTIYAAVLGAKLLVLVPIGAVAAWNHWRLLPRVQHDERAGSRDGALALVTRAVRAEAVGLVVVLAITAVLVNVTPARTAAGIGSLYSEIQPLGEGEVNLVVDPDQAGTNEIHVYLYDDAGAPLAEDEAFDSVLLRLTPPGDELGAIERDPQRISAAHWSLVGNELSIPGQWEVEVEAGRGEFGLSTADFDVKVEP